MNKYIIIREEQSYAVDYEFLRLVNIEDAYIKAYNKDNTLCEKRLVGEKDIYEFEPEEIEKAIKMCRRLNKKDCKVYTANEVLEINSFKIIATDYYIAKEKERLATIKFMEDMKKMMVSKETLISRHEKINNTPMVLGGLSSFLNNGE